MNKITTIILSAMLISGLIACDDDEITPNASNTAKSPEEIAQENEDNKNNNDTPSEWKVVESSSERADDEFSVTIDASKTYQTIEGFGASDCWLGEYIGTNYSSKDKMAKLLFSQDTLSDGSVEGIGLSMWRVNLGAGSYEQGDESGITTADRRAQSYLTGGQYDWSKCPGQQYFMQQAKKYGVEKMLMFSNSPIVSCTDNGQARSDKGASANITDEGYDKYAEYIAEVTKHFDSEGIHIDYISPVNEPQYNWEGHDQEGSGWQNSEVARLVKSIDSKLGSQTTKIVVPEAGAWDYLYGGSNAGRSNQIDDFFGSGSDNYIGDLSHVAKVACAHSYWIDRNWDQLHNVRTSALTAAEGAGIGLWQTEWSMLDEYGATEDYVGLADAKYMDNAIYLSKVIYADMVYANCASWSYWTVWGQERWSQKNRFWLIKLGDNVADYAECYNDITVDNPWADNPNLYVLGNYSRFVRPGYKRVELTTATPETSLFASAYVSGDGNTLVVVYTNQTDKKMRVNPTITGFSGNTKFVRYVTTDTDKLARTNFSDGNIVIPAKSVTTIVLSK